MADNEFGYTRWGMDWVRLAEPLHRTRPEPLLPRARSVARNHGVGLEIEGRIVRAHIHRGGQASVTHLEVEPMPRTIAAAIAEIVADPEQLTDDTHSALIGAGITLAPVLTSTDCSCSARTAHCLHLFAVLYALARRVDENPRVALELRGYFDAGPHEGDPVVAPPRWMPLHSIDPAGYFEPAR